MITISNGRCAVHALIWEAISILRLVAGAVVAMATNLSESARFGTPGAALCAPPDEPDATATGRRRPPRADGGTAIAHQPHFQPGRERRRYRAVPRLP